MPRIDRISSPANPLLRELRRCISRGDAMENGQWIAEGFHLLEEALRSELAVPVILAAESVRTTVERQVGRLQTTRILVLPDALFQTISATESPQGIISLVHPPVWTLDHVFRGRSLVLVLDGLQDPGNAGSAVRAAEAFGASGVILVKGSVNPANPKALRASAGSSFRVPMVAGTAPDLVTAALRQHRLDVYAAVPWNGAATMAGDVDFTRRVALIIGSEGRGLSAALHAVARDVAIPTTGVESLNAATAAAILLYESRRQRTAAGVASGTL
jgi:TrmH family RNA methyltransferase